MAAKTTKAILYHCDSCGNPIAANPNDPVHKPGPATLCSKCVGTYDTKPEKQPKKPDGRGASAKARWEAMTPEQRKERVNKMQAARKASRQAT